MPIPELQPSAFLHVPVPELSQIDNHELMELAQPDRLQRLIITTAKQTFKEIVSINCFEVLQGAKLPLFLEVYQSEVKHSIGLISTQKELPLLQRLLQGACPNWTLKAEAYLPPQTQPVAVMAHLRRQQADWAGTRPIEQFSQSPLAMLLEAAMPTSSAGYTQLSFQILPVSDERRLRAAQDLYVPLKTPWFIYLFAPDIWLMDQLHGKPQLPRFDNDTQRKLLDRLSKPAWEVVAHVILAGASEQELAYRVKAINEVVAHSFSTESGSLALSSWQPMFAQEELYVSSFNHTKAILMGLGELAALLHPQPEDTRLPGVTIITRQNPILPPALFTAPGPIIGTVEQRGQLREVPLPYQSLYLGITPICGSIGMGKSTLIRQIARQVINDKQESPGLVIIDPNATLARDVLLCDVPDGREDETWLFDASDIDHPFGLNLYAGIKQMSREMRIKLADGVTRSAFAKGFSEAIMADVFWHCHALLVDVPDATIWGIKQLLTSSRYRHYALRFTTDYELKSWWLHFDSLSDSEQQRIRQPVLTRTNKLYRSTTMRNILCQSQAPDLDKLINSGSILITQLLSQELEDEDSNLLGEIFLTLVKMALMNRLDPNNTQVFKRCYLAIDESARFQGPVQPLLIAESRKTSTSLILANQYMHRWSEETKLAVSGNPGTYIAFAPGNEDAHFLKDQFYPLSPTDLLRLDAHQIAVRLRLPGGQTLPPFVAQTRKIEAEENHDRLNRIRERSRRVFARPKAVVEAELERLFRGQDSQGYYQENDDGPYEG